MEMNRQQEIDVKEFGMKLLDELKWNRQILFVIMCILIIDIFI